MSRGIREDDARTGGPPGRRILERFYGPADGATSTSAIADRIGADEETVRESLEELARRDEVSRVDLEGEYEAWEPTRDAVYGRPDGNSYTVLDAETGLVTRGSDRARALRRLGTRIDQYDGPDRLAAQVQGVFDAAISPAYLDGPDDVVASFFDPDDVTCYGRFDDGSIRDLPPEGGVVRDRTLQGVAVTAVLDRERFDEVMYLDADRLVAETPVDDAQFPLGVFKVLAVPPIYQRFGVGTALTTHGMAHLAETPPVVSLLWDRDDESNECLAEKYGAERLLTLENALPFERRCTVCGYGNECRCDCVLYGWSLDRGYE